MDFAFRKMHGIGNDFVVIDARQTRLGFTVEQIRAIADRKRGIGCDQVIIIENPSGNADAYLRIFNANGERVGACGNGTRCAASILLVSGGNDLILETDAGQLMASRMSDGNYTVDMGPPRVEWQDIPLARSCDTLNVLISSSMPPAVAVSMGNPHAVFFVDDAEKIDLCRLGPLLENDPIFPEKANIEFASIVMRDRIRMRVWERGAGVTEACGSGACAVLVAAVRRGLSERKAEVVLDGGSLVIEWNADDHVIMTGPVATSFTGEWHD